MSRCSVDAGTPHDMDAELIVSSCRSGVLRSRCSSLSRLDFCLPVLLMRLCAAYTLVLANVSSARAQMRQTTCLLVLCSLATAARAPRGRWLGLMLVNSIADLDHRSGSRARIVNQDLASGSGSGSRAVHWDRAVDLDLDLDFPDPVIPQQQRRKHRIALLAVAR